MRFQLEVIEVGLHNLKVLLLNLDLWMVGHIGLRPRDNALPSLLDGVVQRADTGSLLVDNGRDHALVPILLDVHWNHHHP